MDNPQTDSRKAVRGCMAQKLDRGMLDFSLLVHECDSRLILLLIEGNH